MRKILLVLAVVIISTVMASTQAQAVELGDEIPHVILVKNVNVWDGTSDDLKIGFDVLIVGDKIRKVAKDIPATGDYEVDMKTKKRRSIANSSVGFGYQLSLLNEDGDVEKLQIPVEVIDGKGGTLTPGLIDTHQHIMLPNGGPTDYKNKFDPYMNAHQSAHAAKLMLLRGFTTIRDLMGPSVSLSKAIDQGLTPGPRIFSSQAAISATSGHADFRNYNDFHPNMQGAGFTDAWLAALGWAFLADGPAEVTRATRESLRMGATQIKFMAGGGVASLYDPLESVGYSVEEFRAGVNAARDYDTYVAIHAYNDESVLRALEAGVLDCVHGHMLSESTVKEMGKKGMWLSGMSKPPGLMEIPWFTDENRRKAKIMLAGYDNVSKWAKKYDLKISFGTDAAGSPEMMEMQLAEFEAREPFFTPVEIMRHATSNGGELLALSNSRNPWREAPLGVIKKGAWADLLIYSANPLEDIKAVMDYKNNLKLVIKNGTVYKNEL